MVLLGEAYFSERLNVIAGESNRETAEKIKETQD